MSEDNSRTEELQSALRQKMADNKTIADSFKVEDGTVVVTTEQKTAFDKNMRDIKEIKSLLSDLDTMKSVDQWSSQPAGESAAATYAAAAADLNHLSSREIKSIGQLFLDSAEFKALNGGRNGANMVAPWTVAASLTTQGMYNVKDVFSAIPSGTPG